MATPLLTADAATVQALTHLLSQLTQPDTHVIRQAEAALKPALKQPAAMAALWQIIADAQHQQVSTRQVAALVLRKRLPTHYQQMEAHQKLAWLSQVLQGLATESVRPVRSALTGVVAALQAVDQTAQPPVLQFLAAAVQEASPEARELSFLLLSEMTETVGLHWRNHVQDLHQLFFSVLNHPNEVLSVHKAAVQAVGQLMSFWAEDTEEISLFAPLLPTLLQVAQRAHSDEDFLSTVLDVLYDLAYSPSTALQQYMGNTLQFCLTVLQDRHLEMRVRDAAALVIATTAEAKPKTLGRAVELLGNILDVLFQLMQDSPDSAAGALFESNPAWRQDLDNNGDQDQEDMDGMDSPTETSMAQGTLDMLACEIPKKYIWQPLLQRCMTGMNAPANNARKAGVAGLGVIAEGCAEPLTAALPSVLPAVFQAAQDESAQVRECACFCLGQVSEHCQPDILQYSTQILPIVFCLLDDKSVAVQATSCYVLEMFCERLEPEAVRPLLDPLVRKLAAMLEATTKRSVQEMAVAALAATAVAAEEEFAPYVQGVATLMTPLLQLHDPNLYSLRGRALECMGHMAIAVGRESFRPYFTATMQCAMEGLTTDSTDLQEFAYAVFANLAKVMKEEFAPALPDLVPHLLKVIEQDEGQLEQAEPEGGGGNAFNLDDSDNEDDDENGNYVLHVRTALLEVKKGAITALGEMAANCGTSFCPCLEESMQVLQRAATNWHPVIKCEVADAMPSLVVPSVDAYHNGEIQWKKGDLEATYLSAHTAAIVGAVLQEEVTLLKDEEKTVVGKACGAIQTVIELCGPQALALVAEPCMARVHELLIKAAPCQTAEAMYGELPDDDDDHDTVMQAACDLIGAFCRVLGGQHFGPYMGQFLPAICEYSKPSRTPSDRSMAMGCMSEMAEECNGAIFEHWSSVFLPSILAGLGDEDDNVKRNAAFCAGVSCEHLQGQVAGDYPALLQALGPLFSMEVGGGVQSDATAACLDNAAAAISRMIMALPQAVPLGNVLPALLRILPLKTDMTENETVYACLLGLLQMNQPDVLANTLEVKRIFQAACAADSKVDAEIQAKLQSALQSLHAQ